MTVYVNEHDVNEQLFLDICDVVGGVSIPMLLPLPKLWQIVDSVTDWGASGDVMYDLYPAYAKAWNAGEYDELADAQEAAAAFEDQLHIACVCWNTYNAIEGGVANIWNSEEMMDKLNRFFQAKREAFNAEIEAKLAPPMFEIVGEATYDPETDELT